jgi:ABC-type Na+ transport system ATPase subunit NatA
LVEVTEVVLLHDQVDLEVLVVEDLTHQLQEVQELQDKVIVVEQEILLEEQVLEEAEEEQELLEVQHPLITEVVTVVMVLHLRYLELQ